MKRLSGGEPSRDRPKRLRLGAPGLAASSFKAAVTAPALASSHLSSLKPAPAHPPYSFNWTTSFSASHHLSLASSGDKLQAGVLETLGQTKITAAFKKPFLGVALQSVVVQEPDVSEEVSSVEVPETETKKDKPSIVKRVRSIFADFPILRWALLWREIYLREVLRLDGRADVIGLKQCPGCGIEGFPDHRCEDCRGADLCKACILKWHRYSPFHRLERYNGHFYESISTADCGMRIQLMHSPGEECKFRAFHRTEKFTVIHTNGVHSIPVDYCGCERGIDVPHHIQLMRYRLWPATCEDPQTATTYEALDQFTRLSLLGRLNAYDYYKALEAKSDGAMLRSLANVRQQFTNCVRQFRHTFMFKRAGRGHDCDGILGTSLGGCAVRCPACPDFDMNVPKDWALSPFRVTLSLDANFRLSNKLTRSTDKTDPNLTDGCAYMAPRNDYFAHLKVTEKDAADTASDCSRFGAMAMANQKGGKGLRTTGIAGCFCARHEFVQPLGLGLLRKGERYSTMDWIFCGALSFIRAAQVTVSYDIACQWSKNLHARLAKIPPSRKVWDGVQRFQQHFNSKSISYVVPKFHLYAHKLLCQLKYALGWLRGAAATDGEACERVWAGANPAASSLREMGPGGMSDTMDDMCGAWNWQKLCGIGSLLCERMERALGEALEQAGIFTEFTEAIEEEDGAKLSEWRSNVRRWEENWEKKEGIPSPYHVERHVMSVEEIRLEAAQAQGSAIENAAAQDIDDAAALAQFLLRGLQIESDRARFAVKYSGTGGTVQQATARTTALTGLVRAIKAFRAEQEYHMPLTYGALTLDERDPDRRAALTVDLHMPSNTADKDLVSVAARTMETKLRWASMADVLDDLRHQLRLRGCLNKFKLANITGQRSNTRARTAQDAVDANVKRAAEAYRRHRAAYEVLVGKGDWENTMQVLRPDDCRGLGDRLLEQMEEMSEYNVQRFLEGRRGADSSGETAYKLPWIWYNWTEETGIQITDELMVEWCKSRARAQRWIEEVRLIDEEMRRVVEFNENMAKIWDERGQASGHVEFGEKHSYALDIASDDGARAYACKQSWVRRAQAQRWRVQFAQWRVAAQRLLAVHTSEGLSIEPLQMLSPKEVEEMMALAERRKRKKEAKEAAKEAAKKDVAKALANEAAKKVAAKKVAAEKAAAKKAAA